MTRAASGDVKVYLGNAQQIMFNDALGSSTIGSDGLRLQGRRHRGGGGIGGQDPGSTAP